MAVAIGARVRVACEQVEHDGGHKQAAAVDRCQDDLDVEPAHETTRSAGSVTSVNNASSSSVTRGTVCLMPIQHR